MNYDFEHKALTVSAGKVLKDLPMLSFTQWLRVFAKHSDEKQAEFAGGIVGSCVLEEMKKGGVSC